MLLVHADGQLAGWLEVPRCPLLLLGAVHQRLLLYSIAGVRWAAVLSSGVWGCRLCLHGWT